MRQPCNGISFTCLFPAFGDVVPDGHDRGVGYGYHFHSMVLAVPKDALLKAEAKLKEAKEKKRKKR